MEPDTKNQREMANFTSAETALFAEVRGKNNAKKRKIKRLKSELAHQKRKVESLEKAMKAMCAKNDTSSDDDDMVDVMG